MLLCHLNCKTLSSTIAHLCTAQMLKDKAYTLLGGSYFQFQKCIMCLDIHVEVFTLIYCLNILRVVIVYCIIEKLPSTCVLQSLDVRLALVPSIVLCLLHLYFYSMPYLTLFKQQNCQKLSRFQLCLYHEQFIDLHMY